MADLAGENFVVGDAMDDGTYVLLPSTSALPVDADMADHIAAAIKEAPAMDPEFLGGWIEEALKDAGFDTEKKR